MRLLPLCAIVSLGLAACGGSSGGPVDPDPESVLVVSPPSATLEVLNGTPAELGYTAILRTPDGEEHDVTAEATFQLDLTSVGYFDAERLVATGAGRAIVQATWDGFRGEANVEVFARDVRVGEGVPDTAPDLFDAAVDDPARVMTMVYPSDGTIVPPNLGEFDVHWRDQTGSDLFEVTMKTYYAEVKVYLAGDASVGSWMTFLLDEWNLIARSEVGATIEVTVRGLTQASPGTSSRAAIQVHNSRQDIEGGVYYWAAASTNGVDGIFRHDMARPGEPAEPFLTRVVADGGRCVACHALSRDGARMAITYDGGNGAANVIDVATRTSMMPADDAWNFASFDPTGNELLVARAGVISIRDPSTGGILATPVTSGWSTHPDFSPTGDRIVYVRPASATIDWGFTGGAIVTQTYAAATRTFGGEVPLVSSAENNYYPSISPDGQWVVFNRSTEDAYDDGTAELWIVKIDGTVGPIKLSAANIGPGLTNSWARWAPFEGSYGPAEERIYWLTFSSKRDFGVRLVGASRPQIWMTPFFPDRATAGADPTAPAFRLPMQDLTSNNHIAQWTERVVPVE